MKFVLKMIGRNRVRAARQLLAKDPSPERYVELARECAAADMVGDARRVCEEGLAVFPSSTELKRMYQRARRFELDERIKDLRVVLAEAPRPALRREMCEMLLEIGDLAEAERHASTWREEADDLEARLMQARVLLEVFLAGLTRKTGKPAAAAIDALVQEAPRDLRAWDLRLRFTSSIGAWREARRCAATLLGLRPGDPALEARFRSLDAVSDGAPSVEQALIAVERNGELADERKAGGGGGDGAHAASVSDVRSLLRSLAADPSVLGAYYVRGGTALVQGAKGATAERAARAVRNVLKSSRATARRLGLGGVYKIELTGSFGTLTVAPGEMDAGAVWCRGALPAQTERGLMSIAGLDVSMEEGQ